MQTTIKDYAGGRGFKKIKFKTGLFDSKIKKGEGKILVWLVNCCFASFDTNIRCGSFQMWF